MRWCGLVAEREDAPSYDSVYHGTTYPDFKSFYDHLNARLADDFGYGPYSKGIKQVKRDAITPDCQSPNGTSSAVIISAMVM